MKKLLTALLALCFCVCARAQTGEFFNNERQLSSSFVTQVYVDREGFLWVATRDGDNRYDGYQFRVIRHDNEAENTLASNYVNSIMQDSRGLFYFGMYGALQTWDGNGFRKVKITDMNGKTGHCYAVCFLERRNGDVLAGTSGLGVMKFSDSENAQQMGGPLADLHTVNSLLEDSKDRLWIASDTHGLMCYDGHATTEYLTERNDLSGLCEDPHGNIYVGTSNSGVFKQQGNSFVHLEGTGNQSVSALYCTHSGQVLIGYDGSGVAIYDPVQDQLTDNPFFSMEVDLSKSKVYSFTEDSYGNIWLGLLQKGIYKQPMVSNGFHYLGSRLGPKNTIGDAFVVSTLEDSNKGIWVGTDKDGIYYVGRDGKESRHLKNGYPSVVMTLAEDSKARIWVGSYQEGFGWIDKATMQYHRQPYAADEHLIVMDIVIDQKERMWLATMRHGLLCMDLNDGSIVEYSMDPDAPNDPEVNSIVNDYASQLSLSADGKRLYVSTSMGLCCLDINSLSWTKTFGGNCLNYSVPVRIVKEIDGQLWVGTNTGLSCYNLSGKELKRYTRKEGLTDNGIASIEQAQDGKLWIGTNHGLNCLDPKTGLLQNYYADDGLQSNEFGDNASYVSSDGTIFMGGTGGLTWFNPKDIVHTPWKAKVRLTGFFINGLQINSSARSGGELVTDKPIFTSDHFHLGYHDNSFAIQFSTLTFDNPEHTVYMYSINGEPFIRLQQGVNVITFSHMPPGTYHFRVKAERNDMTTEERAFTIKVTAPWYRTVWAYIIYVLILLGIFAFYLNYLRRREQDHLRLQEHIHAEEMADAKLRFFMNISHEIRTPMTLIVSPLRSLIKKEQDPQRRSIYKTIHRNADRILSLINQMMDLRKIDKGQMQMRMAETDLVAFIQDLHTLFEHQAVAKRITLRFEHDTDNLPVWIDRKNFDKVIVNILSNAFKFTPNGGEIGIRITHDEEHAVISISDNGEKIPEDKLERIFERFYQTPSAANDLYTGTGIGLDLTRSLVELHHGTITVHNLDEGCEFVITIPLGNAHLKSEEMVIEQELEELAAQETEPEEQEIKETQEAESADKVNNRMTMVIVEDDDEIRDYLATELSQDYDVHVASNGREALAEIYRTNPDIVISDVMMPEMDGNALCSKLKTNPGTNHIPVVLLTAKSNEESRLQGLETGADAYLVKPFNMEILKRTVFNLISSHQLLRLKYTRNDSLEQQLPDVEVPKSPDEKLLERVMTAINKHLDDSELSVDMIADEVGISRVHLHRKMKELTGQTPHDFIRNIRLKRAANLLSGGGMNVTEVMYACGFSNSTSFSTIFKKFYGMSPRDYMREHEKQ